MRSSKTLPARKTTLSTVAIVSTALLVFPFAAGNLGCRRDASAQVGADETPPIVSEASTGLLFTWIDDKGEFHVEQTPGAVPEANREAVRVVDPSRDPAQSGRVFIADLRAAKPDGSFPVRTAAREEFESVAVSRREKSGGTTLAPKAAAAAASGNGAPGDTTGRPTVIIYGASWCGPCHQAQAYLKRKGIDFVEKDIEADSGAAREMQAKLARSGKRGGSIPVIDVRGRILVGFDPGAMDRALAL